MESHLKLLVVISLILFSAHSYSKKNINQDVSSAKSHEVQPDVFRRIHFEKTKIKVKDKVINVEIAQSDEQLERGLMFRSSLPKNQGMLFIFDQERILSFWMKNTLIDLSIAYFDKNKKIVDIQEMKATSSLDLQIPSYPSKSPARYALEMNAGWFANNKIKVGDVFEFIEKSRQ